MKRTLIGCALASLLLGGPAAAAPEVDEPTTVHVNAIRKPELRKYKSIVAGLDAFDEYHALAPKVPALQFRIRHRTGITVPDPKDALGVRLEGDGGFVLPIALDSARLFTVPRSEAALDANSELVLNQTRRYYRMVPYIRTPGLPDNVRRLGDLRLECKVLIGIGKAEIPMLAKLAITGVLRTSDWCGFFDRKDYTFSFTTDEQVVAAVLREGERSEELKTEDHSFSVALFEPGWSDNALIELSFEEPRVKPVTTAALTGTAAETPRTAP
ncbi:hypothetical protein [Massilia sp. Mn16-1_5]|uniref:hypothetical protein n=1 Tax=Massilia sp. Mn16-1_5 TaxID=2079199 RepID=UPI00109E38BF|nr:hypothetical protein [Massilia sp. Mn16-1_5]THC42579.1 hypothetical protein C2862_16000 [Massilia sp. Mn16-1_5]